MMYQHMVPQYPFAGMMVSTLNIHWFAAAGESHSSPPAPPLQPVSPFYDPSDMSRYPASVSMAYYQHPNSSDPSIAGGITRDHSSGAFTAEGNKFGRTNEVTSPVSSNPTQQQTQQQQGTAQQCGLPQWPRL